MSCQVCHKLTCVCPILNASAESNKAPHDCIERINAALAKLNTTLDFGTDLYDMDKKYLLFKTKKLNGRMKGKPRNLIASYCPFCGVKL